MAESRVSHRSRQRGIALLLVLWVFMTLGVLAIDFSSYMRDDALAAANFADETRGYYLAVAGINRALFDVNQQRQQTEGVAGATTTTIPDQQVGSTHDEEQPLDEMAIPADGNWHDGTFAGAGYRVRMTDEGGRISLNKADEALLTAIVRHFVRGGNATTGVDSRTQKQIDTIVGSIIDWRDPDDEKHPQGAETKYYQSLKNPYSAKNAFFDSPDELLLVRGVTPDIYYGAEGQPGLRDVVSVYNKKGTLNARTMPAAVLQVLLDVDTDTANQYITERDADVGNFTETLKGLISTTDPTLAPLIVNTPEPDVVYIEAQADTKSDRGRATVAAVIALGGDEAAGIEGPKVMRWFDRAPWVGTMPSMPADQGAPPA